MSIVEWHGDRQPPSSFAGVASDAFWSSTSFETNTTVAWFANLFLGILQGSGKDFIPKRVWPVRGGPR
jgi:hypothetical protein